jgi:ribosomal protein S18 acetylase RimI-like enzyme
MARRRVPNCLVNTSVDNSAALALYDSIGFTPMDEQLTVLHLDVRSLR